VKGIKGNDGAEMVGVAAGEFWMGNNNGASAELPVRRVYLDSFYIDKFEVTNAFLKTLSNARDIRPMRRRAAEHSVTAVIELNSPSV
jgi:formylglycine-generating enzyme required for sulfatase activity